MESTSHDASHVPLVSIGLMTYNRAHYLPGAIKVWLNQTFADFELIISDDASSDATQAICEEAVRHDKRIRYFRQPKNLNAPGCYKFIVNQAHGKYFIWASDDDLWDKRFLEDCLGVFKKDPAAVMVFSDTVDIDKEGDVIVHLEPDNYLPMSRDTYTRLKQHILFYNDVGKLQLLFGLWKRETILDDPMFGPNARNDKYPYYWGFDNYFVFRNLAKGPMGFFPETRFFRRSRVREEYRPPRPLVPRLALSFYHRIEKIFGGPYYWYIIGLIAGMDHLSTWQKTKLITLNFYVMGRLFFVRKL